MRDVALNLFWANRFAMTMYDKRPTRRRDVPRHRDDVYLPLLTPWQDAERKVAAVERQYAALPATWDGAVEDRVFAMLFDVLRHRRIHECERRHEGVGDRIVARLTDRLPFGPR